MSKYVNMVRKRSLEHFLTTNAKQDLLANGAYHPSYQQHRSQHGLDKECVPTFKYIFWGKGWEMHFWCMQVSLSRTIKAYWCTQDPDCLGWRSTASASIIEEITEKKLLKLHVPSHCVSMIPMNLNSEHPLLQDTFCSRVVVNDQWSVT